MKLKQKAAWFFSGILATVMVISATSPTMAALIAKKIQVSTGINLYLNDQKFAPKDANGNPVEPFVYNGTTYLPVRAISEALDIPVKWEGKTHSVYIGKHTGDEPNIWLSDMDYFSGSKNVTVQSSDKDNIGNDHYHCFIQTANNSIKRSYYLDGKYSNITGTLYQRYDKRSEKIWGTTPSQFQIYGDGELLYSYQFSSGDTGIKPIDFNVPLDGILKLEIYLYSGCDNIIALGDAGLWT